MFKKIRNMFFPEKKLNLLHTFINVYKNGDKSYNMDNMEYIINSSQALYCNIYRYSIVIACLVTGLSGRVYVINDLISILVRALIGAIVGTLAAYISLYIFAIEAEKNKSI